MALVPVGSKGIGHVSSLTPDLNMEAKSGFSILLIDNDQSLLAPLQKVVADGDASISYAASVHDGLETCTECSFDIMILRDELTDGPASFAIAEFQAVTDSPEIIIFSETGQVDQAEHALKAGVWEYLVDPLPAEALATVLKRALKYRRNKATEATDSLQVIRSQLARRGIIGRSAIMQNCVDQAVRIAQTEGNILIYGESGTGKELFASAIHSLSSRADHELTVVDCAALAPSLIESTLFGHTKGSFTGADRAQQGLIQQSHGGTLFLDEIGELPLSSQKKLLRVIQERTYLPVGASSEQKSDFRLIAASNRNLNAMVEAGSFREDLLFRLKTFYLELPPLRLRRSDIAELAYYCRDSFCRRQKLKKKTFSPDYLMLLTAYDWPGNVRELQHAIERSMTEAQESPTLYPKHLPSGIRIQVTRKKLSQEQSAGPDDLPPPSLSAGDDEHLPTLKEVRERAVALQEKTYLTRLLRVTGGDIKKSCALAGISRSRLYDLLNKYGLTGRSPQDNPSL
ncbi:sigma-54-dependent transcriptional regulator [Desulfofustis glycolicus]|uniref:Two-component system, NtrC family, response regulator n=1 Tax=Desulfofustis glycolicus DSM 9705 TaxID=1121409 RepID=A0A1M5VYH3_9BACT|nr:sigma-54 dependent transcriptional regulator [Desulfofustis glycolicus]SHH80332.1 two-component system, NtrC family, response regulator [Desulfofustis glycolicus DSM 9705]